jgi:malate dehydrogenase (oxaloacetate-decarboxylating)
VLASPTINRGTAFTTDQRRDLGLVGLLPSGVSTLDGPARRTYAQFRAQPDDLPKWAYQANLWDRNEVPFYRLLSEHIEEMLPIIYTPTVGLAIGWVHLSVDRPGGGRDRAGPRRRGPAGGNRLRGHPRDRGSGCGRVEISIGKLVVYTAVAGIHPHRVLPVVLDVGTDNLALLNDEMCLGERHAGVRDEAAGTTFNPTWGGEPSGTRRYRSRPRSDSGGWDDHDSPMGERCWVGS